jgi:hypothetical protein
VRAPGGQPRPGDGPSRKLRVYPYGIARNRLAQGAKRFNLALEIVDNLKAADALVTLKNYYRRRPRLIVDAERRGVPIYVLRANTVTQIENFLIDVFDLETVEEEPFESAMREAYQAIQAVLDGTPSVDLSPQASHVRRKQHEMVNQANLDSQSHGQEPERHVRVSRK